MAILSALLYVVFALSALLLLVVILLQEPKGGGLAEAFGGVGAETFGVRERGINKFTATVAGVFIGSAVLIHVLGPGKEETAFRGDSPPPAIVPGAPGGTGLGAAPAPSGTGPGAGAAAAPGGTGAGAGASTDTKPN